MKIGVFSVDIKINNNISGARNDIPMDKTNDLGSLRLSKRVRKKPDRLTYKSFGGKMNFMAKRLARRLQTDSSQYS